MKIQDIDEKTKELLRVVSRKRKWPYPIIEDCYDVWPSVYMVDMACDFCYGNYIDPVDLLIWARKAYSLKENKK